MPRAHAILAVLCVALVAPGCAMRCGPTHTVPSQKIHLFTTVPGDYAIRITAREGQPDLPVPPDGRVSFDVPIGSRYCTPYLFGVLKVGWSTPVEKRRVIAVVKGEKVLRRLSVSDISKLETDPDGFRILKLKR